MVLYVTSDGGEISVRNLIGAAKIDPRFEVYCNLSNFNSTAYSISFEKWINAIVCLYTK